MPHDQYLAYAQSSGALIMIACSLARVKAAMKGKPIVIVHDSTVGCDWQHNRY